MKRLFLLSMVGFLVLPLFAGFKPKNVRPKKPEQYQSRAAAGSVTFAADLLLGASEQKEFFYRELASANIAALRIAIFNHGAGEVVLPVESLQLLGPDGKEIAAIAPDAVAEAVLSGASVAAGDRSRKAPVAVRPETRGGIGDPRTDPRDPRYDPRMDPTDPSYDPRDPRNDPYGNGRNTGPWSRSGVDVVLNPGGGGSSADLSRYERDLVVKDFNDKAHIPDPLTSGMTRDRFVYFLLANPPQSPRGFTLRLPRSKGITEEVVLKF